MKKRGNSIFSIFFRLTERLDHDVGWKDKLINFQRDFLERLSLRKLLRDHAWLNLGKDKVG